VLLGDTLELRHGPQREVLAAAEPALAALGEALGPDRELVLVPGNHDHPVLATWLAERGDGRRPAPLRLEERADVASSAVLARIGELAGAHGARFTVAYPGIWLRDDVYATHGHQLDRLITIPTLERLAAGAMGRVVGRLPPRAEPDDFEAALVPVYAWMHAVAQTKSPGWSASRQTASADMWETLSGTGRRTLRGRAAAAAFPAAVGVLNRMGFGPLRPRLSSGELRRAGLRAMGEVVARLDVDAAHVVFGHTHRAGPLPGDDPAEWRAPNGARLHNAGCWIDEPVFTTADPDGPYSGGRVLVIEDEGPPRLERVSDLS
jgi:hypothetical protein